MIGLNTSVTPPNMSPTRIKLSQTDYQTPEITLTPSGLGRFKSAVSLKEGTLSPLLLSPTDKNSSSLAESSVSDSSRPHFEDGSSELSKSKFSPLSSISPRSHESESTGRKNSISKKYRKVHKAEIKKHPEPSSVKIVTPKKSLVDLPKIPLYELSSLSIEFVSNSEHSELSETYRKTGDNSKLKKSQVSIPHFPYIKSTCREKKFQEDTLEEIIEIIYPDSTLNIHDPDMNVLSSSKSHDEDKSFLQSNSYISKSKKTPVTSTLSPRLKRSKESKKDKESLKGHEGLTPFIRGSNPIPLPRPLTMDDYF